MAMALMTACVATGPTPRQLAAANPLTISQDGADYIVALQPGVPGAALTVSAATGAMAMDQGLVAKRAALAFCAKQGARLDARALGHFAGGAWAFDGGCV